MADTARKILLLGSGGQVGQELFALLNGEWELVAPRSSELDLTDANSIRSAVRASQPRWILNAAAYTAVDRAESEPELAFAVNAQAVRVLGEEARACGAAVVHFSTDYVFDGAAASPRSETDPTGPLGVYGSSKLAGETALAASGAPHFIFRTSWVYSTHGKNFMLTIMDLARKREELRIVADQVGAPTFAKDLAQLTQHTMQQAEATASQETISLADAVTRIGGLYHACDAGETSWFGFATAFLALAQEKDQQHRLAKLEPISTAEYPTPARRPADSRLDCTLLRERLGFEMPAWEHSVTRAVDELYAKQPHLSANASPLQT